MPASASAAVPASFAMSQYCQSRDSGFSNFVMPTPTMYDFMPDNS